MVEMIGLGFAGGGDDDSFQLLLFGFVCCFIFFLLLLRVLWWWWTRYFAFSLPYNLLSIKKYYLGFYLFFKFYSINYPPPTP
jgi:hypothetical protein